MNYNLRTIISLISCLLFLASGAPTVNAQAMSNQDYIIKTEKINTNSEANDEESSTSQLTAKHKGSIVTEGVNFKARSGFEDLTSATPFSISLSSDIVDFGAFSPTNPLIRTIDLTTNSQITHGYSILIFEDKSLETSLPSNNSFIPDTTCDNGRCDTQNATEWTDTLTYGLGYRCDNVTGIDCDKSFTKANFYKHFPNIANNDDPISIMSGIGLNNQSIRISYKVNISGNQPQGNYNNVITYINVPNF